MTRDETSCEWLVAAMNLGRCDQRVRSDLLSERGRDARVGTARWVERTVT